MTVIGNALDAQYRIDLEMVVVSGACPRGADFLAEQHAVTHAMEVERHPAQWGVYGKMAGYVRNGEMANLDADICLAFWDGHSRGTKNMIMLAAAAGIPIIIHYEDGRTEEYGQV